MSNAHPQREFTVRLDYETAERLRDFCERHPEARPDETIEDAIHGTMESAARDPQFALDLAGWVGMRIAEKELSANA